MSNKFGATTDHFGLATSAMVLVDSSAVPVAQSRADAQDENGDIAASAWHGNTTAGLKEASCTYALKSGTLPTDLKLGQIAAGKIVLSIEVSTSNGEWPQITVSGITGPDETCVLEQVKTYALGNLGISGLKKAQPYGCSVSNGKLTSCSISASCDWAQQDNGVGEPVAYGVSGAISTVSAEAVATTSTAPSLATADGYTVSQASGATEGQAAWWTASISTEKILAVTIPT